MILAMATNLDSNLWKTLPPELLFCVAERISLTHPMASTSRGIFEVSRRANLNRQLHAGYRQISAIAQLFADWQITQQPQRRDEIERRKREFIQAFHHHVSTLELPCEVCYFVHFRVCVLALKALSQGKDPNLVAQFPFNLRQRAWFRDLASFRMWEWGRMRQLLQRAIPNSMRYGGVRLPIEFCSEILSACLTFPYDIFWLEKVRALMVLLPTSNQRDYVKLECARYLHSTNPFDLGSFYLIREIENQNIRFTALVTFYMRHIFEYGNYAIGRSDYQEINSLKPVYRDRFWFKVLKEAANRRFSHFATRAFAHMRPEAREKFSQTIRELSVKYLCPINLTLVECYKVRIERTHTYPREKHLMALALENQQTVRGWNLNQEVEKATLRGWIPVQFKHKVLQICLQDAHKHRPEVVPGLFRRALASCFHYRYAAAS
jgi:hypothetical protein